MNERNNIELDKQLALTDKQMSSRGLPVDGSAVRQRAKHRSFIRGQRRKCFAAAFLLGIVAIGWRVWMLDSDLNDSSIATTSLPTVESLRAELATLNERQLQIQRQLELLRMQNRIRQVSLELEQNTSARRTSRQSFVANRDSWKVLQQMIRLSRREFNQDERWKLRLLATTYPNTSAGRTAEQILKTNQIPDSLKEPIYE